MHDDAVLMYFHALCFCLFFLQVLCCQNTPELKDFH